MVDQMGLSTSFDKANINGISYTNALLFDTSGASCSVEINAERNQKRFVGDLGIPDDQSSSAAYKVDISLDNAAPILSAEVHFGQTKKIDLDITNVLRIKLAITPLSTSNNTAVIAIGNPAFGR
jgi:NPCBM/NEW2 domain